MKNFPQRYQSYARRIGAEVATLWLSEQLTPRRVRKIMRNVIGQDVTLSSGAFRTTAILPNGVIKVPHDESAIRSTFTEARIFAAVKHNKNIARHFPQAELIVMEGIPVLIQSKVEGIAEHTDWDSLDHVIDFGQKLGVGDVHLHNYGWGEDEQGIYPIFIDCETNEQFTSVSPAEVKRISQKQVRWKYPV
jgi:hypothetical protein